MEGSMLWFNVDKGYGYIQTDDAPCPSIVATERSTTCFPIPTRKNSPCVRRSAGIPQMQTNNNNNKSPRINLKRAVKPS